MFLSNAELASTNASTGPETLTDCQKQFDSNSEMKRKDSWPFPEIDAFKLAPD